MTPRRLKLLGWMQFSRDNVWVSPAGLRFHSFEEARKQAIEDLSDPAKQEAARQRRHY